jgi:CBS domain-containing protein
MKVKDIMSTEPVCCTPDTPLRDVAQLMCDHDCGELPIVDDLVTLRVVGIVTDRDITCRTVALGKNPLTLSAKDCMSAPVVTITPDASLAECLGLMELKQIRRIPVVDGPNGCQGIVSQADLAWHVPASRTAAFLAEVSRPRANA